MSQPELLLVAEFSGTAPLARLLALFHLALKRGSVEKRRVQYISVNISIHMSHRRASATWAVLSSGAIPRGLFRLPQGLVLSSGPVESNNIGVIDYLVIFLQFSRVAKVNWSQSQPQHPPQVIASPLASLLYLLPRCGKLPEVTKVKLFPYLHLPLLFIFYWEGLKLL